MTKAAFRRPSLLNTDVAWLRYELHAASSSERSAALTTPSPSMSADASLVAHLSRSSERSAALITPSRLMSPGRASQESGMRLPLTSISSPFRISSASQAPSLSQSCVKRTSPRSSKQRRRQAARWCWVDRVVEIRRWRTPVVRGVAPAPDDLCTGHETHDGVPPARGNLRDRT